MTSLIAALLLEPFPLWLAGREVGPEVPLIVTDAGRVLHANALAVADGVQPGMRVSGALSRVPSLHVTPLSGPLVAASWAQLLGDLPAFSPRVEALEVGRALLTLTPAAAAELASALSARVGLAPTRELALLAALKAEPGRVCTLHPGEETGFRRTLPLDVLRGVGLSADMAERLNWLGVRSVGDLLTWSRAQQAAFLGAEFTALKPYLHGANSGGVMPAKLASTVAAELGFDEPLYEPRDLLPAISTLAARLLADLGTRQAGRVTVRAHVAGLHFSAAREVKENLRHIQTLERAVARALHDSGAARYGIERLEVVLGDLERPAVQGDLWGRAQARDAARRAEGRYPGCMRRVQWLNVFSLAATSAYQWVRLSDSQPAPTPARIPAPVKEYSHASH